MLLFDRKKRFTKLGIAAMLLLLIGSCKAPKLYPRQPDRNGKIVLKMNRTPCFGSCPVFEATLYENGLLLYNGQRFTVKVGCYYARVDKKELIKLDNWFKKAGFFELKDQYPEQDIGIRDLPTCTLLYTQGARQKEVLDKKVSTPSQLTDLEDKIDTWINIQNLQSCDK